MTFSDFSRAPIAAPLVGTTRSQVARHYALITPNTFVWAPLPGWQATAAAIHISPAMGARFVQATVRMEAGGAGARAAAGVERFVYVTRGALEIDHESAPPHRLQVSDFAFLPADAPHQCASSTGCEFVLFEKPFVRCEGAELPPPQRGSADSIEGDPFQGDPDAQLQILLPDDDRFDMAVNRFTFQPGAALPQVEIHVMEHGLLMLQGAGIYRLGNDWHPVAAGDVIWMASFCPQWFVAMGKEPARYLYYKDVRRDPLGSP